MADEERAGYFQTELQRIPKSAKLWMQWELFCNSETTANLFKYQTLILIFFKVQNLKQKQRIPTGDLS